MTPRDVLTVGGFSEPFEGVTGVGTLVEPGRVKTRKAKAASVKRKAPARKAPVKKAVKRKG